MEEYLMRRNAVLAALQAGRRQYHKLWIQHDARHAVIQDIIQTASQMGLAVQKASKETINEMAGDSRHQGVLLETGPYPYASLADMFVLARQRREPPLLLMLDLLHGPQNIGSLLRTAEICGAHGVIVQDRRAPDVTPAVVQYSAGAAEFLLIGQVTNLARTMDQLKEEDIWVAGLDIDETAVEIGSIDLNLPLAVVVGHEGSGLRRNTKKHCDLIIRLPMRGRTESLNAAVAGSILLYCAWQARGFTGAKQRSLD